MRDQPVFERLDPSIEGNACLREPQTEAYAAIIEYFDDIENHREAGIVLPVGCGKSGLITLAPFALKARRVLVVAQDDVSPRSCCATSTRPSPACSTASARCCLVRSTQSQQRSAVPKPTAATSMPRMSW